jgi:hypothetical protein
MCKPALKKLPRNLAVGRARGNVALRCKALVWLVIHTPDSGSSSQGSIYTR